MANQLYARHALLRSKPSILFALALAVASFCLITLMALLPVGMQGYQQADQQGTMVNLATMVVRRTR